MYTEVYAYAVHSIPFGLHAVASFGHSQSSGPHEHDSMSHLGHSARRRVRQNAHLNKQAS